MGIVPLDRYLLVKLEKEPETVRDSGLVIVASLKQKKVSSGKIISNNDDKLSFGKKVYFDEWAAHPIEDDTYFLAKEDVMGVYED